LTNHLPLTALLIVLISFPILFGGLQVTSAQGEKPILGYPYLTHAGNNGNFTASRFQLNEVATITSMSCQIDIGYSPNEPGGNSTYRFAIYSDNHGQVGELIGQTELGTISKPVGQILTIDDFQTLSFAVPISLQAGTYWLAAVVHGPAIWIGEDQFVESSQLVRCNLNSTSFPATLSSLQYSDNEVVAIYASGQGVSSVMTPSTVAPPKTYYSVPPLSSLSLRINLGRGYPCSFSVYIKGGSGNDINLRIINPEGRIIYDLGRVSNETSFKFYADKPGNYTIILDNEFSVFSSKGVNVYQGNITFSSFEFAGLSINIWAIIILIIISLVVLMTFVVWLRKRKKITIKPLGSS
jgi:hypothetical protein